METGLAALHRPIGESRKPRAAGTNAERFAIVPEPHAANVHIRFDFMRSIWCGAMVGCIGAAMLPPFRENRS